jgi:glyoxylase-like metal-dependent hydrolase (beta-lactamase superfamily II)
MEHSRKNLTLQFLSLVLVTVGMAASAFGDSAVTKTRTVTKLADGIYEIRHPDAPDTFPQGNTTVVIGEHDVLVVDSCYLPSSAREDIADIKKWTDKPVRYLLNTHWHGDHNIGNVEYVKAFPGIHILAHVETLKQMQGYNPRYIERYPKRAALFQQLLDSGKSQSGKPLSESDKRDYRAAIAGTVPVGKEFAGLRLAMPDLTFTQEFDLDLGNRPVQLKYLGRGNTLGDAIAYLPNEKIVVAGDLLDHPVPYLGGGFPFEEADTLKRMADLDFGTIVPGHGDVLHGKQFLNQVIEFIQAVTSIESEEDYEVRGDNSLPTDVEKIKAAQEVVAKKLDMKKYGEVFETGDPDNRDFFEGFSLNGIVKAAYQETHPR